MHGIRNHKRIVAVDLRSQRFGFAVLERPQTLVTWGVGGCRGTAGEIARLSQKRIASLLNFYSPEAIVVRRVASRNTTGRSCREIMFRAMEEEAWRRSVNVAILEQDELQRRFTKKAGATKYEMATQVALLFPELAWKLPRQRKSWMKEHYSLTIFDAVSVGLTYLARPNGSHDPQTPRPG